MMPRLASLAPFTTESYEHKHKLVDVHRVSEKYSEELAAAARSSQSSSARSARTKTSLQSRSASCGVENHGEVTSSPNHDCGLNPLGGVGLRDQSDYLICRSARWKVRLDAPLEACRGRGHANKTASQGTDHSHSGPTRRTRDASYRAHLMTYPRQKRTVRGCFGDGCEVCCSSGCSWCYRVERLFK
jgi:hypothetical protein